MLIRFLICGAVGWCMEIVWTGLGSLMRRDFRLISNTSVWMFFIYGMAAFLPLVSNFVANLPLIARGGVYVLCIFAAEYAAGWVLTQFNACPWDYSGARYSVNGIIRLDYAPVWFAAGLIFEYLNKMLVF